MYCSRRWRLERRRVKRHIPTLTLKAVAWQPRAGTIETAQITQVDFWLQYRRGIPCVQGSNRSSVRTGDMQAPTTSETHINSPTLNNTAMKSTRHVLHGFWQTNVLSRADHGIDNASLKQNKVKSL